MAVRHADTNDIRRDRTWQLVTLTAGVLPLVLALGVAATHMLSLLLLIMFHMGYATGMHKWSCMS